MDPKVERVSFIDVGATSLTTSILISGARSAFRNFLRKSFRVALLSVRK